MKKPGDDPARRAFGKALRLLALSYPVSGVALLVAAYFQSVGQARQALLLTLGGILLIKLPVLLLASHWAGLNGIWASEALSELLLCALALLLLKNSQRVPHPNP
ncbi:MAG: multidrug efflux pump VmrA [Chloroflexi bacterium ADurb.Bin360]|nr:MAG: multidrug efflux pump VmrA [Chloroflexi bacterium ADurb.Bin360]